MDASWSSLLDAQEFVARLTPGFVARVRRELRTPKIGVELEDGDGYRAAEVLSEGQRLVLLTAVQTKALEFMLKFQTDPRATGIDFERVQAARDKSLRSVRIGDDYRGIVFHAPQSNVLIWLRLDKHDEAYHWAVKHKLSISPSGRDLERRDLLPLSPQIGECR